MTLPEIKIKHILYATDLSENARLALAYAVNLADQYRARLSLIHVLEDIPSLDSKVLGYISQDHWNEIKKGHEDEARTTLTGKLRGQGTFKVVLDQINQNARAELADPRYETGEVLVKRGNPVEEILDQADALKVDLIVMGTHGLGTLKDAMMGGTSRRVLRRSKVPVLVVRLPA